MYYGLNNKFTISEKNEYLELYQDFKKDVNFRKIVSRIASGLHLDILNIDTTGAYFRAHSKTQFSYSSHNLVRFTKNNQESPFLLIFIGLAAYIFPRDTSFDEESSFSTLPITIHDFDNFIRDKCKETIDKINSKGHVSDDPSTELLLTSFLSLPTSETLRDKSRNTSSNLIKKALKFLVSLGFFIEEEPEFYPTKKFFHHMESLSENDSIKQLIELFGG